MSDCEIVHVAIASPDTIDAGLVRNVAGIINKSPYDTRLLLARDIPKVIGHYNDVKTAESIIQNLKALGLIAIALGDSELRKTPQIFKVQTLEFQEKEVLFKDSRNHEHRIGRNDVFLILEGRIQTSSEIETTKTKTKLNLAATLLTGGIPVTRRVNVKTVSRSTQLEYFARVYTRKSSDPIWEILQYHVNYSFLGTSMALSSSLTNFNAMIVKLREMFPQAIFDDRLVKLLGVNASSSLVSEDTERSCKLIYLLYLAKASLS